MDASTGWDLLDEVLEQACRDAANPEFGQAARLFRAISELKEVLPI
jgi:hypothetical protein